MKSKLYKAFTAGLVGSLGEVMGVGVAVAATPISTNIATGGTLNVTGASILSSLTLDNTANNTTPLTIKTNGSAVNYTATNSGIFIKDAAGTEILRIVA